MTVSSDEDVYYGEVKNFTFGIDFFLGQINDLDMAVVGVVNT